jgi:hypothetical protein
MRKKFKKEKEKYERMKRLIIFIIFGLRREKMHGTVSELG